MNTRIIHAGFATAEHAQGTRDALLSAGFPAEQIALFQTQTTPDSGLDPGLGPVSTLADPPSQALDGAVLPNPDAGASYPGERATPEGDADARAPNVGSGAATGAVSGTAVGLAVGLVSAPFVGPLAPVAATAIGAYVGSLMGALNGLEGPQDPPVAEGEQVPASALPWRVAIATPTPVQQNAAVDILKAQGAYDLRDSDGQIVASTWLDFNPDDSSHALTSADVAQIRERSHADTV